MIIGRTEILRLTVFRHKIITALTKMLFQVNTSIPAFASISVKIAIISGQFARLLPDNWIFRSLYFLRFLDNLFIRLIIKHRLFSRFLELYQIDNLVLFSINLIVQQLYLVFDMSSRTELISAPHFYYKYHLHILT